jgi:ribosomal-protein-alanine N-acetyltransferase
MVGTDRDLILETARLYLRKMSPADADALLAILGHPQTMIHFPRPFDRELVGRWIERAERSYTEHGFGLYAVILRETGELIGDCGFLVQEVDGRSEMELGYHLGHRWWGHAYAPESARACVAHAFGPLDRSRLISLIRPVNTQSRRVAEKVGLTIEKETIFKGLHHYVYSIARGLP